MGNQCNRGQVSVAGKGKSQASKEDQPLSCNNQDHVEQTFECQAPKCAMKPLICINCAIQSTENDERMICRLCRTAEYMRKLDVDSIKIDTRHNIKLVSCVAYDRQKRTFVTNKGVGGGAQTDEELNKTMQAVVGLEDHYEQKVLSGGSSRISQSSGTYSQDQPLAVVNEEIALAEIRTQDDVRELFSKLNIRRNVNPTDFYRIVDRLNESFYRAMRLETQQLCMIKSITSPEAPSREFDQLQNQLVAVSKVKNDKIVLYIDAFDFQQHYFLIFELLDGGSIKDIIKGSALLPSEKFCIYTLWCVAMALAELHSEQVCLRDLQSEIILCNSEGPKIADLGNIAFLSAIGERLSQSPSSSALQAPEVHTGQQRKPADIWNLGVLGYELATRRLPEGVTSETLNSRLEIDPQMEHRSPEFKQFLQRCLEIEPEARPTIEQVLEHAFLDGAESYQSDWKNWHQEFRHVTQNGAVKQ